MSCVARLQTPPPASPASSAAEPHPEIQELQEKLEQLEELNQCQDNIIQSLRQHIATAMTLEVAFRHDSLLFSMIAPCGDLTVVPQAQEAVQLLEQIKEAQARCRDPETGQSWESLALEARAELSLSAEKVLYTAP